MIFDGREFAKEIEEEVKREVEKLVKKPVVVSILVGNDPASELYTSLKKKAAERVGIEYRVERLPKAEEIEGLIKKVQDKADGIMIQLPIPGLSRDDQDEIVKLIPLNKDVDGLRWEESNVTPATVKAVMLILESMANNQYPKINNQTIINPQITNIKTGKEFWKQKFLVVGGTGAVGRPLAHYLMKDCGVDAEIANSKTNNLSEVVKRSQIVISCVGRAGLITKDMIRDTSIVIDVGISKKDGKVAGDMESDVYQKSSLSVPVPGGVGPVTVASLMKNALDMVQSQS